MRDSQRWVSPRSHLRAFAVFAVVLSPAFLQTITCQTGNANLASLELEVGGVDQIVFVPGQALYTVTMSSDTAVLRAQSEDPNATLRYQWWTGSTLHGTWDFGVGSGEVTLDVPEGQNMLRVNVTAPGGASFSTDIEITNSLVCAGVTCPDDGNDCTDDVCDPATGECHVPLPDGSVCESGNGECSQGLCRGPEWLAIYRGGSIYQAVAMNPRGDGMAVWNETGFYLGDPDRLAARAYNVNDGWEQGWFDAFRVDNVEANVHGGVDVAMDEDGYAIAVWQQWLDGTGQAVYASRYTPGVGWDPQVPISSGGGDRQRYDLQVKVDSAGRALAVWVERETDNQTYVLYELWANHFSPLPTPTWGTPEIIDTQTGGNALSADLGMDWNGTQWDGTTGVVVWLEQASGGGNYIWARHYRGGWEVTPVQLGQAYSVDVQPQVEMDVTGDAIAVWRQTATEIWTNRATSASGTAWGQPEFLVTVDLPPSVHDPLTLAMAPFARPPIDNQQEAIFAWPQVNGADFDLWAMRYTPGSGSGWGPAELIETHDGEVSSVDVAMDGQGNASAVWVRTPSDGSDPQVWINRYDKFPYPNLSLDGWRTAERLERFTGGASNPHVAMDSNRDGVVVFDAGAGPYGQSTRWTFAGAPTLSNPRVTHVPSSVWCLPNNYFRFQADYYDPDGDVVGTSAVRVFVDVLYDNHVENLGGFPSDIYESEPVYNQLSGSGFSGTITANNCRYFGAAEWADVSLTIRDAAGNESHNTVTMRVDKPAGAN